MITGGYLKDVPLPHERQWPGEKRQRRLRINIMVYYGIGRHYYVSAEQEHNPIWDSSDGADWGRPGKPNGWTACWDDEEGAGKMLSTGALSTHIEATMWIEDILLPQFPDHDVTINGQEMFQYLREGD